MKIYRSLNAQINSTNMGLHNIRKYTNIDSLIINVSELRHELRDREGDLRILGKNECHQSMFMTCLLLCPIRYDVISLYRILVY